MTSKLIVLWNTKTIGKILSSHQTFLQNSMDWLEESFQVIDPSNYKETTLNNKGVQTIVNNPNIEASFVTLRSVLQSSMVSVASSLQALQTCLDNIDERDWNNFVNSYSTFRLTIPNSFLALRNVYSQIYNQIPENANENTVTSNQEFIYNWTGQPKIICLDALESILFLGYTNFETAQNEMYRTYGNTPKHTGTRIFTILQSDWNNVLTGSKKITISSNLILRHFRDLRNATFYNSTNSTLDKYPQTAKTLYELTNMNTNLSTLQNFHVTLYNQTVTI